MKKVVIGVILLISLFYGYFYFNSYKLKDIFEDKIYKIESRNSGNGLLYATTNEELITKFISEMNSTTYTKRFLNNGSVGSTSFILYNQERVKIGEVVIETDKLLRIGGTKYKASKGIDLKDFIKEFYVDMNIVS